MAFCFHIVSKDSFPFFFAVDFFEFFFNPEPNFFVYNFYDNKWLWFQCNESNEETAETSFVVDTLCVIFVCMQ